MVLVTVDLRLIGNRVWPTVIYGLLNGANINDLE